MGCPEWETLRSEPAQPYRTNAFDAALRLALAIQSHPPQAQL